MAQKTAAIANNNKTVAPARQETGNKNEATLKKIWVAISSMVTWKRSTMIDEEPKAKVMQTNMNETYVANGHTSKMLLSQQSGKGTHKEDMQLKTMHGTKGLHCQHCGDMPSASGSNARAICYGTIVRCIQMTRCSVHL